NVLVKQLLLQVDGMRRDNRFTVVFQSEKRGWDEVSQRFPDSSSGLNDEMAISFQRIRYRRCHLLLFGPILKILCARQQAFFPKHSTNVLGEPVVEILAKRDHRCPSLKGVLGVFPRVSYI